MIKLILILKKRMVTFKQLYRRIFFSQETHFLLNYATLSISDKEINSKYFDELGKGFDKGFKPAMVGSFLYFIYELSRYISDSNYPLIRLLISLYFIFHMLIWSLIRWRFRNHAPKFTISILIAACMLSNFSIRD